MDIEKVARKIPPLISGIDKDEALGVAERAANLVAQNSRHPGISKAATLLAFGIGQIDRARRDRETNEAPHQNSASHTSTMSRRAGDVGQTPTPAVHRPAAAGWSSEPMSAD